MKLDTARIAHHIGCLLTLLEPETHNREGLLDTPKRVAKYWEEFLIPPEFKFTVFNAEGMTEMITEAGIAYHSVCEHHLLGFSGQAYVAYLPSKVIAGASKLAHTVRYFAGRLQNQERLTSQIAEYLQEQLQNPEGVAVVMDGTHSCMSCRGVRQSGVILRTTKLLGAFKDNSSTRQEFMNSLPRVV